MPTRFWSSAQARWFGHGGLLLTFTQGYNIAQGITAKGPHVTCIQFGFGYVTTTTERPI